MAKQSQKREQEFMTLLATDSDVLMKFIKDPEGVMDAHKISDKAMRERIRNALALEVAKKLVVYPGSFHLHWG